MTSPSAMPATLYAATARPSQSFPGLDGNTRADVVVVGGGLTGLSTALHLAESGARVVVLEAHEPGWGASGRNGGHVNPGLKPDPDEIVGHLGAERGERTVRFAWSAAQFTFDLIGRLGIACDARQNGTLRVAYSPRHADGVRTSAEQGMRRGFPVRLLERDEVARRTGTDRYVVAMLDESGGDLQPLDYSRGLAVAAQRAGAVIHGATPVRDLARSPGGWTVSCAGGTVSAQTVVLATNGYTDALVPALRRSIVPVFSSIVSSSVLPPDVAAQVMPTRSVLYESGHITVYLRVDRDGRLLMGGRGPQHPISTADAISYLAHYARRLWPIIGDVRWEKAWNGQLAMTTDHYPHLHRIEPGLIACLGYNGRGVAMATAMGHEVARLVQGAHPDDIALPLSAVTPIPFHAFWRLGVIAKVLEGRIRDRLDL